MRSSGNCSALRAQRRESGARTSCPPAAYGAITWVLCIAANVSNARIVQPLLAKFAPVHMLNAPEASSGDGRGLCALGHVHRLSGSGRHACEWAEELGEKGHREVEEERQECVEELQFGDSRLGNDLGATMTELDVFMGLTDSPHDRDEGSMMPSLSDKSRGAG
jgi:hypothetical protein